MLNEKLACFFNAAICFNGLFFLFTAGLALDFFLVVSTSAELPIEATSISSSLPKQVAVISILMDTVIAVSAYFKIITIQKKFFKTKGLLFVCCVRGLTFN